MADIRAKKNSFYLLAEETEEDFIMTRTYRNPKKASKIKYQKDTKIKEEEDPDPPKPEPQPEPEPEEVKSEETFLQKMLRKNFPKCLKQKKHM